MLIPPPPTAHQHLHLAQLGATGQTTSFSVKHDLGFVPGAADGGSEELHQRSLSQFIGNTLLKKAMNPQDSWTISPPQDNKDGGEHRKRSRKNPEHNQNPRMRRAGLSQAHACLQGHQRSCALRVKNTTALQLPEELWDSSIPLSVMSAR